MKKRKIIILLTSIILLYLTFCLGASFWNFFYGPVQSYLYNKYVTTYDGNIELLRGYTIDENGNYYIYVKGKIKSNDSQEFVITIPKKYIDNSISNDTSEDKYIHTQKEDICLIETVNIGSIQKDELVSIDGDRHLLISNYNNSLQNIHIVVKHINDYRRIFSILNPFAIIIDFLISPFNIRPFVPV